MGFFNLFSKKETSFEMAIIDVFLINNHGVVVTGKINKGFIQMFGSSSSSIDNGF